MGRMVLLYQVQPGTLLAVLSVILETSTVIPLMTLLSEDLQPILIILMPQAKVMLSLEQIKDFLLTLTCLPSTVRMGLLSKDLKPKVLVAVQLVRREILMEMG